MNFSGKTALLTGASKGLGQALAGQLDARGCRLIMIARDSARLAELKGRLQVSDSCWFSCDLSHSADRAALVEQLLHTETRIDLLIHCAGIGSHSKLNQLTADEIRLLFEVNTVAPLELTAGLLPLLPADEPAGIVHIGSVAGELPLPGMSLYSASKAALHAFSRAALLELANEHHFSLLVVLGALRHTHFAESIRHPANKQPELYRRLDINPEKAAAQIVAAIERRRAYLVIPWWYRLLLGLNRILLPLTMRATGFFYRKFR